MGVAAEEDLLSLPARDDTIAFKQTMPLRHNHHCMIDDLEWVDMSNLVKFGEENGLNRAWFPW